MARKPAAHEVHQPSLFPEPDHIDVPVVASTDETQLRVKARRVHELLCKEYRCPIGYFHNLDPLSELVSSLLSHRTRNKESGIAYKGLRAALPTWEEVIEAPTAQVQELISAVTWPELKAPRIQRVLRNVRELHGELSLEFLQERSVPDATAWLRQLPGVGAKTAAAVLSFSTLRKPALPVDSHHHRVAERLGLVPPNTSLDRAHVLLVAQLPMGLSGQEVYDNHEILMLHGQRVCTHARPKCEVCVLASMCPSCRVPVNAT